MVAGRFGNADDRGIVYTLATAPAPTFPSIGWQGGLFPSISGRLRSALWPMFLRAAKKNVSHENQHLAVRELLFLRCRLTVRRLLPRIGRLRSEIPKQP